MMEVLYGAQRRHNSRKVMGDQGPGILLFWIGCLPEMDIESGVRNSYESQLLPVTIHILVGPFGQYMPFVLEVYSKFY